MIDILILIIFILQLIGIWKNDNRIGILEGKMMILEIERKARLKKEVADSE